MDYSARHNWVFAPKKRKQKHLVDVFYVYPTVYVHPNQNKNHYMPVGNPLYRLFAIVISWWQSRVFCRSCNIFAPYYRQVGLECLKMTDAEFKESARHPFEDVRKAFFYYLNHLNEGRPFILAGHSQGSAMLMQLMREEFKGDRYKKQFVAAYLPGFSLGHDDFIIHPQFRLAKAEDDLGVVITYNTSAKGLSLMRVVHKDAVCVNPLNWKHTAEYAGKELNLGSVLFEAGRVSIARKHFTGAYIDMKQHVLIIDRDALDELLHIRIGFFNRILMNRGSLHMLDYSLFHRNLQCNVKKRIEKFFEVYGVRSDPTES
ncbi:MAG: DUF3089 domain-containing protein [Christensenellaceae bacterium]